MSETVTKRNTHKCRIEDTLIQNRIKMAIVDAASDMQKMPTEVENLILKQASNISRHWLTKIINNNAQPDLRELWQISQILNCTVDSLIVAEDSAK